MMTEAFEEFSVGGINEIFDLSNIDERVYIM